MADVGTEDPQTLPPRKQSAISMEVQAPRMTAKEYFEDNLERVHDSLVRRITEYHNVVERALVEKSRYIQSESAQISSNSSVSQRRFKVPLRSGR